MSNEETKPEETPSSSPPAAALAPSTPASAIMPVFGHEDDRNVNAFSSSAAFAVGQRMAHALACSTLVPVAYQNNIPNVMIAMELANRIGASVFAVMQNLDIIHGRPAWRASFLIATVNACGRFTPLRFRFEGKPGTPSYGCRAVAKDRGDGEECVGSLITLALAQSEGWVEKKGSKWKTMPEQMLQYRAAAFWSRIYAPELSLGMRTADEQEDIGGVVVAEPVPVATALRQDNRSLDSLLPPKQPSPTQPAERPQADRSLPTSHPDAEPPEDWSPPE
jgi:hypothetical protein